MAGASFDSDQSLMALIASPNTAEPIAFAPSSLIAVTSAGVSDSTRVTFCDGSARRSVGDLQRETSYGGSRMETCESAH